MKQYLLLASLLVLVGFGCGNAAPTTDVPQAKEAPMEPTAETDDTVQVTSTMESEEMTEEEETSVSTTTKEMEGKDDDTDNVAKEDDATTEKNEAANTSEPTKDKSAPAESATAPAVATTINLSAENFAFVDASGQENPTLVVPAGAPVTVNLNTTQSFHDFVVEGMSGAATDAIGVGASDSVTFTPTEPGEYTYYCSIGSHREMGMVGTLIVE